MKEVYLAYFDLLGFKEFILKNNDTHISKRMEHVFRDLETSLCQGNGYIINNGIGIADISKFKLQCLVISDTILIWTNDCESYSLIEFLNVAYDFNCRMIRFNFPLRGAVLKGKIEEISGKYVNKENGSYSVQCVYGKGVIDAHLKAECQNWAGTVIDNSIIDDLIKFDSLDFLNDKATKYKVPYKNNIINDEEYVFKIVKTPFEDLFLKNTLNNIDKLFTKDNKSIGDNRVQIKIENTKAFIISTQYEEM